MEDNKLDLEVDLANELEEVEFDSSLVNVYNLIGSNMYFEKNLIVPITLNGSHLDQCLYIYMVLSLTFSLSHM